MANPSFSRDIQPLFKRYCTDAGCHADNFSAYGNLNLLEGMAYSQLVNVAPFTPCLGPVRVDGVRGDPSKSVLIKRLDGSCGAQMPLGLPPLEPGQIETIRSWILHGALND